MKIINSIFYLFIIGVLISSCAKRPSPRLISGRWEGYYIYDFPIIYDSVEVVERDSTKLTIDITQVNDSVVLCKTISPDANAEGNGKYDKKLSSLFLKETKYSQIKKDTTGIQFCLGNYFLKYRKSGSEEQLVGTTTSQPNTNGTDCGGGDIYLKKSGCKTSGTINTVQVIGSLDNLNR